MTTSLADGTTLPDLVIQSPAKFNLFFEIVGNRSDGYHNIETLAAPLSVTDTIRFWRTEEPGVQFSLEINNKTFDLVRAPLQPDDLTVPDDERNLAYKAALTVQTQYEVRQGIRIALKKNVPPQSGLGAGSANAAAVLRACNQLWDLNLPTSDLVKLGAKLGADVPLFFFPVRQLRRGIGELVTPAIQGVRRNAVLFRPPVGIPTREVYRRCCVPERRHSVEPLLDSLVKRDWERFDTLVFNRLEEYAAPLTDWVNTMRKAFMSLGCQGCCLSGSGSAYFGLFDSEPSARRAAESLRHEFPGWIQAVEVIL